MRGYGRPPREWGTRTALCAPIFSECYGLPTRVNAGTAEGLEHDHAIHCDGLMSIEKSRLTDYVGELSEAKEAELDRALQVALALMTEKSRKGAGR